MSEAVRRHVEAVREARGWLLTLPAGDIRTEALILGRFVFEELARERQVFDVFEQEGDRLAELRDLFREQTSDPAYRAMSGLLRRWIGHDVDRDLDALGVLVLGGLINVHRSAWTLGGDPAGVPEDQILSAWADLCVDVVKSVG